MQPLVSGYDELRLRIDHREGGSYRVLASTHSAEASGTFEPPFNELEIENFVLKLSRPRGRRQIDTSALDNARHFGGALFKALFNGQIHELYRDALTQARIHGRGVRITLCLSGVPELIDVPWEYLFDDPDFLAMSAFTPVVRYLDLPRPHRPLLVEPPLRVLGVISSPAEYERLDVERERENLERALSALQQIGAVAVHWLERPTLGALLKALQTSTFHAFHYIGHGAFDREAQRGVLLLEDDSGWARPVSGDKLGMILHDFSSLRLAILNACEGARTARSDPFAGVAGSLVQRDIPAVVAMQAQISDEAAIVFASSFYEQVAAGSPVDASLAAARLAILAERSDDIEWGTPVLFMRVPDGRIFDLGSQAEPISSEAPRTKINGAGSRAQAMDLPGSPAVFVNYRHEDTAGHALLVAERLRQQFGADNVSLSMEHGFELDRLAETQRRSAFLTLIGPAWTASLKTPSARHDDPVRREIEWALRNMPDNVVPVLIDATMPDAERLPRSLRGLCRTKPVVLRHASFDHDLNGLIGRLKQTAEPRSRTPTPSRDSGVKSGRSTAVTTRRAGPHVAAGVPDPYEDHFVDVIAAMLDGSVVPLLGPGIGGSSQSGDRLATQLADAFQTKPTRLAEVAQRVAVTVGERRLYATVKELLAAQSQPNEVHRFLAAFPGILRQLGLPPRHQLIISSTYDSGLERAFEEANEPFDYAVYLAASGWFVHVPWGEHAAEPLATTIREPRLYVDFPIDDDGQLERTIIVKIHGGPDGHEGGVVWRNNLVITEDHYIDYLPTHNIQDHLPIQLLEKVTGCRCLFVGYVLRDWAARVFLRRIWRGKPISESSWAIEHDPDPLEKASWSVVGHVELLAADPAEYVGTLRSMLLTGGRR